MRQITCIRLIFGQWYKKLVLCEKDIDYSSKWSYWVDLTCLCPDHWYWRWHAHMWVR